MIIQLWLKNFRRYQNEKFQFKAGVNTIHGDNNVGKTTVLYAIEYVLFGRVGNFKALSALIPPTEKSVGVEIIFQGKDKKFYQLQRIHVIPEKSRTKVLGHYTLKQFSFDPRQSDDAADIYILSSDFQDREEALALKLQEILGISHKLFDIAMNLRQGEITAILDGAAKLDVVLGITAAVLAVEELRAMALGYEKETTALAVHKETLKRLNIDKAEYLARQKTSNKELVAINESIHELSAIGTLKSQIDQLVKPLEQQYQQFRTILDALAQNEQALITNQQTLAEQVKTTGTEKELAQKQQDLATKITTADTQKQDINQQQEKRITQQRELDHQKGDLVGRIKRRQSLSKDKDAHCEACGQSINIQQNQQEIDLWLKEQQKIEQQLSKIQQQIDDIKDKRNVLNQQASADALALNNLKQQRQNLSELTQKIEKTSAKHAELLNSSQNHLDLLVNTVKAYQENILTLEMLEAFRSEVVLNVDVSLWQTAKPIYADEMQQALNDLKERLKISLVKAEMDLQAKKQNQQRVENVLKELKPKLNHIDQLLSETQDHIDGLLQKANAAKELRLLAKGFKEIQTQLRDQSSIQLAEKTLEIYQVLSQNKKEFKKLVIDKSTYSVQVTPFDVARQMPASLSQGGGHKLLLGIAFKLAIGQLVGPCPFILLDEPTYGLDKKRKANLFKQLNELQVSEQMIMISHDIDTSGHHIFVDRKGKHTRQVQVEENS